MTNHHGRFRSLSVNLQSECPLKRISTVAAQDEV